jgi:methyl-accepting chemotaxis protein
MTSTSIAVTLLIVFMFIGLITVNFITEKVEQDVYDYTVIQSESISKDIEGIFNSAATYTRQMALNRDIVTLLKEVKSWEDIRLHKDFTYVYDYLIGIQSSEKIHFISWIASREGNYYLDSRGITSDETYDVVKRPWYPVAMANESVGFTPPYKEWSTDNIVISSILALREAGEAYGYVVVDIELSSIPIIVESMKHNKNDRTFIITEEGNYIYHENPEIGIENSIYDEGDLLGDYVTQIIESQGELHSIAYDNKNYYLMSHKIERNGWYIVSLIDRFQVKSQLNHIFRVIFSFMLGAFVVATVLIYLIVKNRTSPYKILLSFAEDIAEGDYSKNIPKAYIDRQDEMGAISHSFQKIIDAFRNENFILEEKVEQINTVLEKQYKYILETEKAASLGNLVAGVSHEINTPLGVSISTSSHIESITENIIEKMTVNEMSKEDLYHYFEHVEEATRILNSNLDRAARLVRSFKNIAVDQGSEIKEEFALSKIIEDVVTSLKNEYKRKRHKIEYLCDDIVIKSYPGLFSQLFTNLIMNSIQHGFRNRMDGNINIECWLDGALLFIVYQDNGKGISEEEQKKVFEPFYTTFRENGNSGLGMSIIHNIITQNLHGKIKMESLEDEYTKFTIVIPIDH